MSCPKPVSTYLVNMDLSAITSFFAMRSPWRRMLTCDTYTSMLNIILEWYNLHAYVHPEPPSGQCPLPLQHQSSPDRHRVAARGTCWAMSHPRRNTTAEGNFCNACRTIYRASNLAHATTRHPIHATTMHVGWLGAALLSGSALEPSIP